jgi:hypothetical protein
MSHIDYFRHYLLLSFILYDYYTDITAIDFRQSLLSHWYLHYATPIIRQLFTTIYAVSMSARQLRRAASFAEPWAATGHAALSQ